MVLSDWRLPGRTGGDLLDELRGRGIPSAVIVMTAYGSIAHAVEAVRRGAADYLAKPFEREALLLAVQRVFRTRDLGRENLRLRAEADQGRLRRDHWSRSGHAAALSDPRKGRRHRGDGPGDG